MSEVKITQALDGTFTLNVDDPHAVRALLAYARSVAEHDRPLANSICEVIAKRQYPNSEPWWHMRDFYEFMVELPDMEQADEAASRLEAAVDRVMTWARSPKVVANENGDPLFLVVNEYEEGTYPTHDDPGDPGYDYWRVATLEEWAAFRAEQEARRG